MHDSSRDARDQAAELRDRELTTREGSGGKHAEIILRAAEDRRSAAADRTAAAEGRARAAADRAQAARDRELATRTALQAQSDRGERWNSSRSLKLTG